MTEVLDFGMAIAQAKRSSQDVHVLLGNGFSRAYDDKIFSYSKLLEQGDFSQIDSVTRGFFDKLGTADFEAVMKHLVFAVEVVREYSPDTKDLLNKIEKEAELLKEVLLKAIAKTHPGCQKDVREGKYAACRCFLANFKYVFTLNYDLLVYWVILHKETKPELYCDDGFRKPSGELVWKEDNPDQTVFFIHGALHLFEEGAKLRKHNWEEGRLLVDKIRESLKSGRFPLFVAEGRSDDKLAKIKSSPYLNYCYKRLGALKGTLFLHGLSLAQSDEHIVSAIQDSHVNALFVSLHGDPNSESNTKIVARLARLQNDRKIEGHPVSVVYYDSDSAKVWG